MPVDRDGSSTANALLIFPVPVTVKLLTPLLLSVIFPVVNVPVIVGLPASTTFPVPVVATSPKVPLSDRMRPLVPLSTVVVPTVILVAERPLRVQLPPRVQV